MSTAPVPFLDLSRRAATLAGVVVPRLEAVFRSGHWLLGPELDRFEAAFAERMGHRHAVGVASGTDALRLTLAALGIGPGDEVIVPAMTAVPSAAAVCAVGATPVIVDIDPHSAALNVEAALAAQTSRTKAVMPVHLYGRPANVCELGALGVPILEDAAQAHDAVTPPGCGRDPMCGTNGCAPGPRTPSVATAYSFYPTKNLGAFGDGGAVVTDDATLDQTLRRLRFHGQTELYMHVDIATNSRLSEANAAVLHASLDRLAEWTRRRRTIARTYRQAAPTLRWQADHPRHVFHLCVARVANREQFRKALDAQGIGTAVHYPRAITEQPAYQALVRSACPEAEAWGREVVSVPCFPELTDHEVVRVCEALQTVASQDFAQ